MKRHHLTLSPQVSELVQTQIASGRFKDFSAAVNEIVWSALAGAVSVYQEYGVTAEEVAAAAKRVKSEIAAERRQGKLEAWRR